MTIRKVSKLIGGIVVFFTLPSLLFFGFIYLKYDEALPTGNQGVEADALAAKMLESLNYKAYQETDYIEWSFKHKRNYKWYKTADSCIVQWNDFKVVLDFKNSKNSKVFVLNKDYNGIEKQDYIKKAESYFNNDSFWLVAPYKVFDKGTERRLVITNENKKALLITYTTGGSTPGDSYLWHLDSSGKPTHFQMWVDILPIDGIEASWNDWTTAESGAILPTFHKLLFLGLEINDIKGTKSTIRRTE